jgi:hypothetical protein
MRKPSALALPVVALLVALAAPAAGAQTMQTTQTMKNQPGYLPIEQLNLFPPEKLSVEVNIEGPILRMVAAATKHDDPGFSAVIAGLKGITLQAFPLKGVDATAVKARIAGAVRWLEGHAWTASIKVRDKGAETYVYLKQSGDRIEGLTLLSVSPGDEAVVINIVGTIDPAQLGRIGQKFDLPQLQKIPAPSGAKKPK